jgi:hypothetical protein
MWLVDADIGDGDVIIRECTSGLATARIFHDKETGKWVLGLHTIINGQEYRAWPRHESLPANRTIAAILTKFANACIKAPLYRR